VTLVCTATLHRCEYRLSIRADNADRRLTEKAHALGLVSDAQLAVYHRKEARLDTALAALRNDVVLTSSAWNKRGFSVKLNGKHSSAADMLQVCPFFSKCSHFCLRTPPSLSASMPLSVAPGHDAGAASGGVS
jgi:tRNA U34 5-carboxymethylaminomethyl modifying enzyme MnmG/GidA